MKKKSFEHLLIWSGAFEIFFGKNVNKRLIFWIIKEKTGSARILNYLARMCVAKEKRYFEHFVIWTGTLEIFLGNLLILFFAPFSQFFFQADF